MIDFGHIDPDKEDRRALESCLNKAYGDRILLYFKQSNIHYAHMFRFLSRETGAHSPAKFLMVDCKTILETRKWASSYMKKEKVDRLKKALKEGKCPVMDMEF